MLHSIWFFTSLLVTIEYPRGVQRYAATCTVNNSLSSLHHESIVLDTAVCCRPAQDRTAGARPGEGLANLHMGGDSAGDDHGRAMSVMQAKAKARESASQAERRAALADLAVYDQEIGIEHDQGSRCPVAA